MLLTLKNKMLMGLDRMIEQARKQKYAVIKEIELEPIEYVQLIHEVNNHEDPDERVEIKKLFRVTSNRQDDDNCVMTQIFFAKDQEFVDNWYKGYYTVTYRGVKLRIIPKKKPETQTD